MKHFSTYYASSSYKAVDWVKEAAIRAGSAKWLTAIKYGGAYGENPMGLCARAALNNNKVVYGYNPNTIPAEPVPPHYINRFYLVDYDVVEKGLTLDDYPPSHRREALKTMHKRQYDMLKPEPQWQQTDYRHSIIINGGGPGTLAELTEVAAARAAGILNYPIFLLVPNKENTLWEPVKEFLKIVNSKNLFYTIAIDEMDHIPKIASSYPKPYFDGAALARMQSNRLKTYWPKNALHPRRYIELTGAGACWENAALAAETICSINLNTTALSTDKGFDPNFDLRLILRGEKWCWLNEFFKNANVIQTAPESILQIYDLVNEKASLESILSRPRKVDDPSKKWGKSSAEIALGAG